MAPLRQGVVAPAPPWFCLIHPTLKPSRTFQIRAQILKKLGNFKSQQEVTQNSKSCPALSGAAPQSRREPASPGVTWCHPWVPGLSEVPGALGRGQPFPWEKLFQPNHPGPGSSLRAALAQEVTFQAVALGTKCPGASRSHSGLQRPLPADPNWEYWERTRGVIPCRARCHPRSPPSSRAEGVWGSSGIGAVPISSGAGNLGIPGFYQPCQNPTPVWGSLLGILWLPVTSERPFPCPHPFHPCPSDLPVFPGAISPTSRITPSPSSLPAFPAIPAIPMAPCPTPPIFPRIPSSLPAGIRPFQPSRKVPRSRFFPFWETHGLSSPEFGMSRA